MDSFYGGKQGISFVIKERFKDIAAMNEAFAKPLYDKVWYGEYCIIDTENKNNKDNGKIFRRTGTHTNTNDSKYAEYIGQVVGPAGGVPNVQMETIGTLQKNFEALKDKSGLVYYWGKENKNSESSSYHQIETNKIPVLDQGSLLTPKEFVTKIDYKSGKDYYNTITTESGKKEKVYYNPNLKYEFYTFQSNDKDGTTGDFPIATIGLAFEIPYPDFEISEIGQNNPGENSTIELLPLNGTSDFYRKYKITIPTNIPGPSLRDISVTTSNENIYDISQTVFNEGKLIIPKRTSYKDSPFSTSSKIEIGQLYYYNTDTDDSDNVIGYTPVQDPQTYEYNEEDPEKIINSEPAWFYIKDVYEINNVILGTEQSENEFGQLTFYNTKKSGNDNATTTFSIPLLKEFQFSIDKDETGQWVKATPVYAGVTPTESYKVAPFQWGVWATELTKENEEMTPSGPIPADNTPIEKIDFSNASKGNLGVYYWKDNDQNIHHEFYYWKLSKHINETDPSKFTWTGEWVKIGESEEVLNQIYLTVENFTITDSTSPVTIASANKPMSVTPSNNFSNQWYVWR